jgi:hypothetical protein
MFGGRQIKRLACWMACLALLWGALAPVLSHLVQRDVPAGWVEICSVTGAKLVRLDDGAGRSGAAADTAAPAEPTERSRLHVTTHCPYCALHVDALGLPPAAPAAPAMLSPSPPRPEPLRLTPRTPRTWASAQPRAPPLNA